MIDLHYRAAAFILRAPAPSNGFAVAQPPLAVGEHAVVRRVEQVDVAGHRQQQEVATS